MSKRLVPDKFATTIAADTLSPTTTRPTTQAVKLGGTGQPKISTGSSVALPTHASALIVFEGLQPPVKYARRDDLLG
ncbi:hypothetical protein BC936DRAFT_147759 [Jimgerdemannia flammicorona]|uniref:Uncharacterized protein n=1 Tax=Jimgerdemannia flammicorona TaxID=994334 RepID=A0A433D4K9_9FUNG|nr:hypothetical protein BC936DRAFT_147759 [Jimgerdemannia flammicorona]